MFDKEKSIKIISIALFLIALIVGYKTILWGEFGDEGAILATGNLLNNGYNLYQNIFSHHFPLPYYWSSIITHIFGKSISIQRLCLASLQFMILFITMLSSKEYLVVGILSLLWSVFRLFYKGNMLVYSSFSSIALVGILIIVFSMIKQRSKSGKHQWLILGFFSLIALGSDPLTIYPVCLTMIFLIIRNYRLGLKTIGVIFGGIIIYIGYLILTHNLNNFISDTIVFNSVVYSKYTDTNPLRFNRLIYYAFSGLEIFNADWYNFSLFPKISFEFTMFDKWIFTGFLYRFGIITTALSCIINKRYSAGFYLYLFAVSTLLINKWDFRALPFILTALFAISTQIASLKWIPQPHFLRYPIIIGRLLVICLSIWSTIWLSFYILSSPDQYSKKIFSPYQASARKIQQYTCNQNDVYLAYYPIGNYLYWYTDLKPVSKYVYMWPWVADVGLEDVLSTLKNKDIKAIVVVQRITIWGKYPTEDYLKPLIKYLENRYIKIDPETYVSPKLFRTCTP